MGNSQVFKLNLSNLLFILFIALLNISLILYLINNQFYIFLSIIVTISIIGYSVSIYYTLNKYIKLKDKLNTLNIQFEKVRDDYKKEAAKNKEALNELETSNAELKALNLQLIKSKKELQEVSDYRGKFLVNVSHELRTPLNAIIGFTTIMTDENYRPDGDDFKEMIKVIHDSSKRLLNLINNILNIAKLETNITEIRPQEISLHVVYESIVSLAKGLLKDNQKIIFNYEIDENVPNVIADEKNLLRALTQFIDNAVKYTEKGEILFRITSDNENVEIIIKDTGKGIPQDKLNEIMEPFIAQFNEYGRIEQLDSEKKGFSFAIAKYLIEKMGGIFYIHSEEDFGTTIKIKLKRV